MFALKVPTMWKHVVRMKHVAVENSSQHFLRVPDSFNSCVKVLTEAKSGSTAPLAFPPRFQPLRDLTEAISLHLCFVSGNSPATTPGSSPLLGRKFQDGVPVGVSRLPRGPPNNTEKGFQSAWNKKLKGEVLVDQLRQEVTDVAIVKWKRPT